VLCVATPRTSEPILLIAENSKFRIMIARAPFRFISFEIRVTSKIMFCCEFRYKYGCLEISRRDATERLQRDETRIEESGRSICLNSYRVKFRRGVIVEWLNEFAWLSNYLWNNIINIVVDIVTRCIRVLLYYL